jgi:hypothetical protein
MQAKRILVVDNDPTTLDARLRAAIDSPSGTFGGERGGAPA